MSYAQSEIAKLYSAAKKCKGTYEYKKQKWQEFHDLAQRIVHKLPFKWQSVYCDNPYNNQGGNSTGKSHIVLRQDVTFGKTKRKQRDVICKPFDKFNGNLFGEGN